MPRGIPRDCRNRKFLIRPGGRFPLISVFSQRAVINAIYIPRGFNDAVSPGNERKVREPWRSKVLSAARSFGRRANWQTSRFSVLSPVLAFPHRSRTSHSSASIRVWAPRVWEKFASATGDASKRRACLARGSLATEYFNPTLVYNCTFQVYNHYNKSV